MNEPVKTGLPVIGIIFLVLAAFNFFRGENWIVWFILGLLFGGTRIFAGKTSGDGQ